MLLKKIEVSHKVHPGEGFQDFRKNKMVKKYISDIENSDIIYVKASVYSKLLIIFQKKVTKIIEDLKKNIELMFMAIVIVKLCYS